MASMQTDLAMDHNNDGSAVSNLQNSQLTNLCNYQVVKRDGSLAVMVVEKIIKCLQRTCDSMGSVIAQKLILDEVVKNLFNRIKTYEVVDILIFLN